jgi:hypothetical protein
VAGLCLVAGSPIPEDENRPISFAVTTETPTTTLQGLHEAHQNLSSVCQSMIPAHQGSQAQDSTAPYKVNVSTTTVARQGVVSGKNVVKLPRADPPPKALSQVSRLFTVSELTLTVFYSSSFFRSHGWAVQRALCPSTQWAERAGWTVHALCRRTREAVQLWQRAGRK